MGDWSAGDQRSFARPRACISCHNRKVKCDVSNCGVPCTRCSQRGQAATCQLVPFPDRSSEKRKRHRRQIDKDVIEPRVQMAGVVDSLEPTQSLTTSRTSGPQVVLGEPNCTAASTAYAPDNTFDTSPEPYHLPPPPQVPTPTRSDFNTNSADGIAEEDCQIETYLEMADSPNEPYDMTRAPARQTRELYTYHGGTDSTTILSQALSIETPRRLVKILLRESEDAVNEPTRWRDLDTTEALPESTALELPSTCTRRKLVQLHFERVYPYLPVLDRLYFVKKLADRSCSPFLLQCVFTSVAPYLSTEVLRETKHRDRDQAQKAFFSKACALYDTGAERSQLCLLQGSLILTSSYFSYGLDKDCRFWLSNAVRILTQMGFHRRHIVESFGRKTKRLALRLYWVTYIRDTILMMAGRTSVPMLDKRYCDMPEVSQDDWEDEALGELTHHGLLPVSFVQKSFLVYHSRLAKICTQYIDWFKCPSVSPTKTSYEDIERQLSVWDKSLPPQLHVAHANDGSSESIWVLVLRAMAYRFECVFYRDVRTHAALEPSSNSCYALRKQQNAMFEFDSIIRRIMLHNLVAFCPFSITTCTSTTMAMHVECILDQSVSRVQKELSLASIHTGLAYLRAGAQHWNSVRWSLRMFDAIVSRIRSCAEEESNTDRLDLALTLKRSGSVSARQKQGSGPDGARTATATSNNSGQDTFAISNSYDDHAVENDHEKDFLYESMPADNFDIEGALDGISFEQLLGTDLFQEWMYSGSNL